MHIVAVLLTGARKLSAEIRGNFTPEWLETARNFLLGLGSNASVEAAFWGRDDLLPKLFEATTDYLLLATYYLLLTTYYLQLTTYY